MQDATNWDDMRLLLAISRRRSMLGAAQELDLAVSTVSRRITKFEQSVGSPLLERRVDGCSLTDAGKRLAVLAEGLAAELEREYVVNRAKTGTLSGTVRLTSGDGFVPIILETIAKFTAAHPDVTIEYSVEPEYRNVARGDVDVAVRVSNHGEPSLIYKKITEIAFGVFASQKYAATLLETPKPEEVSYIGLLPPLSEEPHMKAARAAGFVGSQLRLSSFNAQIAAVKADLGAAVLPKLAAKGLVELFPQLALPPLDVYVVNRPQALKQRHLRAFVDSLYATLKAAESQRI
ncbi:MAG: LysR family transcriptional regulator [Pseudomonadota bacterium]